MTLQTQPSNGAVKVSRTQSPEEIIEEQKRKIAQLQQDKTTLEQRLQATEGAILFLMDMA